MKEIGNYHAYKINGKMLSTLIITVSFVFYYVIIAVEHPTIANSGNLFEIINWENINYENNKYMTAITERHLM